MAKKTSKKKNKRGGRDKILGEVATTLISILVGAIVESLIERLLQPTPSHNIDDDEDSARHQHSKILESSDRDRSDAKDRHHPIKNVVSKLANNVGQVQLTRKELLEAVSSFAKKPTFNLDDVSDILKNITKRAVESSINPVGNEAEVVFEGVTDTLRNITNTIDLNDTDRSDKKDKKKNKKKKKKKS